MGGKVSGESVLPTHHREVSLPLERLRRHVLVLGASGSGKTETLLRLAWPTARVSDWAVFFLDAKGDERTMRRFHALMADTGREARLFPREPRRSPGRGGRRHRARSSPMRLVLAHEPSTLLR